MVSNAKRHFSEIVKDTKYYFTQLDKITDAINMTLLLTLIILKNEKSVKNYCFPKHCLADVL